MKLNAPDGKFSVLYPHDFPFIRFSSDFQTLGQGVALDHERVVASGCERIGHPGEQIFPVVLNEGGFTMHHPVIYNDISAENMADALMPEANAERWDL